jgi:UDP-N-acetylmuramate--L-alanine ligase/UDP-N-acetylenolpyruvoylglucosamine reductase
VNTEAAHAQAHRRRLLARLGRPAGEEPLRVHCAGIGGTGLSGLARLAADLGHAVAGSDRSPSPLSESLAARGIPVTYEQTAANLDADPDLFVATAALPPDHPELRRAQELRVPVVKYAEALGAFVAARRGVAVAGTHGKTTTTGLLAAILTACGQQPGFIVGGQPRDLPVNAANGAGETLVFEACEFDRSFRHYAPEVAVILNVEEDHLDCYRGGLDEIIEAFVGFGAQLKPDGALIVNGDCAASLRVAELVQGIRPDVRVETFSTRGNGRYTAQRLRLEDGLPRFTLSISGAPIAPVALALAGAHNVGNALAAIAAARHLGVEPARAAASADAYSGVRRRFDVLAEGDVTVVNDYAHHPTAIAAVIEATRARFPGRRVIACFEPHQASRTRELFDDFVEALGSADRVLIADIYLCRDQDSDAQSVSAGALAQAVARAKPSSEAVHVGDLAQLEAEALAQAASGDVALFLGAGKIGAAALRVAEHVVTHPVHPAGNAAVLPDAMLEGPPQLLLRDQLEAVLERDLGELVRLDEALGPYCTFRAGGKARFFAAPTNQEQAIHVVRTLQRHGVPVVPLGGGSNVLFTADRFDGAVVLMRRMRQVRFVGDVLRADAGASLPAAIRLAETRGLGGLERFAGIPGTLGGAVFGNAGGPPNTPTVGDRVTRARVLEADGSVRWRSRDELGLSYRHSELAGALVLAVDLQLAADDAERLRTVRRDATIRKASCQPLGAWSAGCTFRNPSGGSAGRLIDELGLKGLRRGAAEVSPVHGNFIVNTGGAHPRDILGLMDEVRSRVFHARGVTLHPELRLIA